MTQEQEFLKYLQTCVKTTRKTDNNPLFLGGNAPKDYCKFLHSEKLFDYNLEKWKDVDMYKITNASKAEEIYHSLNNDSNFKMRDEQDNGHWRSGAIAHYVCFLRAKELFGNNTQIVNEASIDKFPLQRILYGAPGTGKSFSVRKEIAEHKGVRVEDIDMEADYIIRTTFHPDYDYAQFVGCYKPVEVSQNVVTGIPEIVDYNLTEDQLAVIYGDLVLNKNKNSLGVGRWLYSSKYWKCFSQNYGKNDIQTVMTKAKETSNAGWHTIAGAVKFYEELEKNSSVYKKEISYRFTPQVFTQALIKSYETSAPVYLVIEEINRGNCAQIFGDIFQLLDRKSEGDFKGESEYSINVDEDLRKYLEEKCPAAIKDGKIKLPRNFNIIATMNTSDQSLFPMDSAFKRRWDWEYVAVDYKNEKSGKFEITIGSEIYSWHTFLEAVNKKIKDVTKSEDKQMGNFFIKQSVNEEEFCNKVMFYLWNDVSKDYYESNDSLFQCKTNNGTTHFSFNELFGDQQTTLLKGFMEFIGCKVKTSSDGNGGGQQNTDDASQGDTQSE